MISSRKLLLLPALALFAGCGDSGSPTDPNNPGSGTIAFTYSGAVSGSFSATGAVQVVAGQPQFGTWAFGWREDGEFGVLGVRADGTNRGDVVVIDAWSVAGTGNYPVGEDCSGTDQCAEIYFTSDLDSVAQTRGANCHLTSGTLTVNSLSSNRAQGTFSGQGFCDPDGDDEPGAFTIANGSFNVPVITAPAF